MFVLNFYRLQLSRIERQLASCEQAVAKTEQELTSLDKSNNNQNEQFAESGSLRKTDNANQVENIGLILY